MKRMVIRNRTCEGLPRFITGVLIFFFLSFLLVNCKPLSGFLPGEKKAKKKVRDTFRKRLLDKDVPGRDLPDLPRFPGSSRISDTIILGTDNKRSGTIVYRSAENRDKVIDFYLSVMKEKEWVLKEIVDVSEGKIFQLQKDNRKVSLSITTKKASKKSKYTEITIMYREY